MLSSKRILSGVLALTLAASVVLTASCGSDGGEEDVHVETTQLADWTAYTIIRSDTAGGDYVKAATTLRAALKEKLGAEPKLETDWVKRGEAAPTDTKEFLIGSTNRAESAVETRFLLEDFEVGFKNGRLYIVGGSGSAVLAGTEWFIEHCIDEKKGTFSVPSEPYVFRAEYEMDKVNVAGIPLYDYTIRISRQDENLALADAIMAKLSGLTGHTMTTNDDDAKGEIVIERAESCPLLDYSLKAANGKITLTANPSGASLDDLTNLLFSALEKREDDELASLDIKKSVGADEYRMADAALIAEWRKMTDDRIASIRAAKNMTIPAGATVYYVSNDGDDANDGKSPEKPWKTLTKVNALPGGNNIFVCFRRGDMWRGSVTCKAGVTYTAYGEGDKPVFTTSPMNGADPKMWVECADCKGVWKFTGCTFENDVGLLTFNEGEQHAVKYIKKTVDGVVTNDTYKVPFNDYHDLMYDLDFWHEPDDLSVYLRSSTNPGERFKSIEFSVKANCFGVSSNSNVTIDNLCIKYVGAHGVGAGTVKNLTVQNCEFGWIGGGIQYIRDEATVRFGNGVEIYGGCDGYLVENNYLYQIYDAAITQQVSLTDDQQAKGTVLDQKDVTYRGNVIEYANYSIEYFLGKVPEDNPSRMENFLIEDNYMWYAGTGLCEQRPNLNAGAHIKGWDHDNRATDYVIKDNLFIDSKDILIHISSSRLNPDGSESMPTLQNNIFAGRIGLRLGSCSQTNRTWVPYDLSMLDYLGEKTRGDLFYFLSNDLDTEGKNPVKTISSTIRPRAIDPEADYAASLAKKAK